MISFIVGVCVEHSGNAKATRKAQLKGTAILVTLVMTVGCTVVGTGTRTVIKAESGSEYTAKLLPGYIVPAGAPQESRVAVFKDNTIPHQASWFLGSDTDVLDVLDAFDKYKVVKYGTPKPQTALLSAEVRDLGKIPVFSPTIQGLAATEVLKIMTDAATSSSEKENRKNLLLNSFLNVPQSFEIKTLNRIEQTPDKNDRNFKGTCEIYHYYPHIEVDLSADVLSPSLNDRFSELIFLINVDNDSFTKGVRFVNFLPKDTDIAEFSRGMLKESTAAQVRGSYGLTRSSQATNVSGNQTTGSSVSPTLGGDVSITYSEGLERDLKEAIEKKTTGIVQNGQTFLADLRALRNVRIGGSYRFDLLLEVPADVKATIKDLAIINQVCESAPVQQEVRAHVVIVGVVRHVEELGLTGVFQRVPEAENDDVFEEVVLHETLPDEKQLIWSFNGEPAARPTVEAQQEQIRLVDKKSPHKPRK